MNNDVLLKLAVYGEGGVGKTSLVNVFFGKEVPSDYSPTFNSIISKIDYVLEKAGVIFKINIWDVGGNKSINPTINTAFFTDVDLALLVFDLSDPEKTLKTHKIDFLDKLAKYSDEPLTLIVGNKLDKVSLNASFISAIGDYLGENSRFSIISAKSDVNVHECIELLIYTFLKKAEILNPDLAPENSSSEFMEKVGKDETELRNQLVTLSTFESKFRDIKSNVKFVYDTKKEDTIEKYQEFIQKELKKISVQKETVVDKFLKNIIELEKDINQLKKQNIKAAVELIEKLASSLENSKKYSEQNLGALLKLNREENELMIINSKSRADDVESKSKAKEMPLFVKKIKAEPTPKTKVSSTKVEENEVKVAPKANVTPTIVEEVKVKTAPKEKVTPAIVEEVKVKAAPKEKVTPSKLKKVKIGSTPIKKDPKIELYNNYERENPGKRAVYRGKETKGFLTWKDQIKN